MIVFPEGAEAVTGASHPLFQVEAGHEHVMIRPLQAHARGNLFIHFKNRTIVVLSLSTTNRGGENVVTLRFATSSSPQKQVDMLALNTSLSDLNFLARPWKVKKVRLQEKAAGLLTDIKYVLQIGENVLLHFRCVPSATATLYTGRTQRNNALRKNPNSSPTFL